jgi:hypothetical protein
MCRCIDILEIVRVGVYTYTYYLQYINTPARTTFSISIHLHVLPSVYQYTYTYYLQYVNTPTRTIRVGVLIY